MKQYDFYLIRGLGREAAHWGEFAKTLQAQDFVSSVTCLDLPGSGKYNKISSPLTIGEYAEFILTQIQPGKNPKVILSISLGSMVAIEMVRKAPHLFTQLYVMNTSFANLSPLHHRLQIKAFKSLARIILIGDAKKREMEVLKLTSNNSEAWPHMVELWADIAEKRPIAMKNFIRQLLAAGSYRIAKQSPAIPTIVLASGKDRMVDPSCSEKLAQHWNLPIYRNPEAGHDLAIDAPEWLIETVAETLP